MTENNSKTPPVMRLSYRKGDLIIKEGDYGVSIYKIIEGSVVVFRESNGQEVPLATLGVDDIFGERTFLNRATQTRSASVRALEYTIVEVWHMATLSKEYAQIPPIIKYITDQILARSIRMNNLIVRLSTEQQKKALKAKNSDSKASMRQFYRKKVELPCRYRPAGASSKMKFQGRIRDISLTGLAMAVKKMDIPAASKVTGEQFTVAAVLPNKHTLELTAEVLAIKKGEKPEEIIFSMSTTQISEKSKKTLGFFLMP